MGSSAYTHDHGVGDPYDPYEPPGRLGRPSDQRRRRVPRPGEPDESGAVRMVRDAEAAHARRGLSPDRQLVLCSYAHQHPPVRRAPREFHGRLAARDGVPTPRDARTRSCAWALHAGVFPDGI